MHGTTRTDRRPCTSTGERAPARQTSGAARPRGGRVRTRGSRGGRRPARGPARGLRPPREFDDFYRSEFPAVVGLAYALSGNRAGAEDLAQEAFLAAHSNWGR